MKNTTTDKTKLKLIASHSLVIAIFTSPYVTYVLADVYKIATNDTTTVVANQSFTDSMLLLSLIALMVSIVTFSVYMIKRNK